jgi:Arc/MetJ-type ribon-helix-helix transcriptional regulator
MRNNVEPLHPPKATESEKITINLGYVDLGRIDLLVREGFYSNRADLIRTAIRNHLASHVEMLDTSVARNAMDLGLRDFGRGELEDALKRGEPLHIKVVGLARIASDVTPELARGAIASVTVLGSLKASPEVKAALADRIR